MARRDAALDEGRTGRQGQRRLRDIGLRTSLQALTEQLDFLPAGRRSDQHAVAAGTLGLLHHQLRQVRQDVRQFLRLATLPGRHVVQQRVFAEVEADHVRHVGIDRLVVGHPGTDRVGQHQVAGPVGGQQAGHAEQRIRVERQRVEEGVVDPSVDHVHRLRSGRRAHVDPLVADEQIGAFDQFHAHLAGEEGVFEVGAVETSRRQYHHARRFDVTGPL